MRFGKWMAGVILPIGASACGTLSLGRAEAPVVAPVVIPAECRVESVEPEAVAEPAMPPLPAPNAANYAAIRIQRAERAGLYYQARAQALQYAYDTNASAQRACKRGLEGQ